jgi:hypothetical protein
MKYIELFEKFNDKQLADIDDILLELKDDGFNIEVKRHYNGSLQINISININNSTWGIIGLKEFHFSRIEDVANRLIEYLNDYKFDFIAHDVNTNFVEKFDELSNKDLIYFQLFFSKD